MCALLTRPFADGKVLSGVRKTCKGQKSRLVGVSLTRPFTDRKVFGTEESALEKDLCQR